MSPSDICEPKFQYMTDADIIGAATKPKDENWEEKSKGGKTMIALVTSWHYSMLRGQWDLILQQQGKFKLLLKV
jgi:hypothetical protein